ncbi:hypothetical protein ANOM_010266 [Aspergillus nomiae NRRL 13137]|uniref:Uncharacterized protein n=1 Tax=Aspergillus nomiae NRRL (strain ATCC 15546 / NRRL 13137 / CBS 260.88 / M93) TaxID=1509407 RepID=A0A0L1IQP9_ASPN3|nr:uncharacterized protein ANOM_010266 [Aspergillus nomiae NRRL 13137]KNG81822.1 hypothetical protein ANOM_010266 [Aspergillus nomiae NRRL 13137]
MSLDIIPNWLRIILLISSVASFLPQLQRIWYTKQFTGLSLSYVLCNLMSATEQFTLLFFLLVNKTEDADVIQKTTGDWINLAQLAALLISTTFSLGLYYPSDQHSRERKISSSIMYTMLLLVSIVPVVADAIDYYLLSAGEDAAYRDFGLDIFGGYHFGYIHPAMTLVGIYAWFPQNHELRSRAQLHSLSQTGLAVQAVIFAFVAISWTMRMNLYDSNLPDLPFWATIPEWFIYVWWAAVDNILFALVQTSLYLKIRRHEQFSTDQETQPLLAESASESEE